MRWPWIARARLDDAIGQIVHLRAEVDKLTDNLVRISRREAGLSETPRDPRPALKPMPPDLADYIRGFASSSVQKTMRDTAYRQHAAGKTWGEIVANTMIEEKKP